MPDSSTSAFSAQLPVHAGHFNTTHWSVVLLAGKSGESQSDTALEFLCRAYWPPLYAYVRRQGHSPHDAQDLTQEFFVRLFEKDYLKLADRHRGRFRSFLIKSLQHFLVNDWMRGQTQKRGGGRTIVSIDGEAAERLDLPSTANQLAPEAIFDKRWAITVLEHAMERLGAEYRASGKTEVFENLRGLLLTEGTGEAYCRSALILGISEGAVKVAVHRLRQRFREAVRLEITQTVASPEDVDDELRYLMTALSA